MKLFAGVTLVIALASTAHAQHQTFTVNPDLSEVKIKLNTTHEVVNGMFHVQSGAVSFDRAASKMEGSILVIAASGKTGNDSRDKRMTREILKDDQFATLSFAPEAYLGTISASGDSTIQVSGVFTLLGTGHSISVPIHLHIDGPTATAKAQFTIPYVQWGLKNPSFLFWKAENDVAIALSLVGSLSK